MITKKDIEGIRSGVFTASQLHDLSSDGRLSLDAYVKLYVLPEIEKAVLAGSFFIQLKVTPGRDPDVSSLIDFLKFTHELEAYVKADYVEEEADTILVVVRWVHAQ